MKWFIATLVCTCILAGVRADNNSGEGSNGCCSASSAVRFRAATTGVTLSLATTGYTFGACSKDGCFSMRTCNATLAVCMATTPCTDATGGLSCLAIDPCIPPRTTTTRTPRTTTPRTTTTPLPCNGPVQLRLATVGFTLSATKGEGISYRRCRGTTGLQDCLTVVTCNGTRWHSDDDEQSGCVVKTPCNRTARTCFTEIACGQTSGTPPPPPVCSAESFQLVPALDGVVYIPASSGVKFTQCNSTAALNNPCFTTVKCKGEDKRAGAICVKSVDCKSPDRSTAVCFTKAPCS